VCGAIYENSDLKNYTAGWAQLVFIWLFGISYDIGFSGMLIAYALEVLPFKLRAKGMMIMNITVQAVLALSNQTNKIAWNRLPRHWYFMLFYTVSSSISTQKHIVAIYPYNLSMLSLTFLHQYYTRVE